MKKPMNESGKKPGRYVTLPRLTPIAIACSTLLLPAGVAFAQQVQELAPVVVTGLRASIESSIATKRNSDSIVEAVSSKISGSCPKPVSPRRWHVCRVSPRSASMVAIR